MEAWLKIVSAGGSDLSTLETYTQTIKILCESLPAAAATRVTQIKGHLSALRAIQCYLQADGENARKHARAACENIPLQHKRARVSVHIFQAGAYQMVGDLETGLPIYLDEIKKSARHDNRYLSLYQAYLCFIYWMDADLNALLLNIESPLKRRDDGGLPGTAGISRYFQGIACYHQNKLQKAEEALAAIGKDFYFVNPVAYAHSAVALALVYQAGGSGHRARKVCKEVVALATENNHQDALLIMQTFEAEQALRRGYLAVASAWARRFMAKSFLPPSHFYWPILTLIKIRLAEDTADSQQQAADLLDELDDFLASIHNHQFRIHVLALQAMRYDTLGERPVALEKLAKALDLAEPGGFIRLFVDLGPQMADLLKQLLNKQNVAVDYIKQILAAFSEDGRSLSPSPSHPTPQPLVDPLTHRELDILELLAHRLQNKEIAEKLFISDQTVKGHLKNIYQKLNVRNRRQAVEKARKIGILSGGV